MSSPIAAVKVASKQLIESLDGFPESLKNVECWFPNNVHQAHEAFTMLKHLSNKNYVTVLSYLKGFPSLFDRTEMKATTLGIDLICYAVEQVGNTETLLN